MRQWLAGLVGAMIVITCSHCGRRSLLPLTMVTAMSREIDPVGRVAYRLTFTCWCGEVGTKTIRGPRPHQAA